mgnify:CR=1 FL=1
MIYLASPYSHPDPKIKERRFQDVCRYAAAMFRNGIHVFSPIAHTHPISVYGLWEWKWEQWKEYDLEFIAMCSEMWVLMLPGWEESVGVAAEIKIAKGLGKPVRYVDRT